MAVQLKSLSAICIIVAALALPTSLPSVAQTAQSIGDALVTRTYKLDPAKIQKLGTTLLNNPSEPRLPSDILRALLQHDHIQIPATNVITSSPNEKAFYFNDRTGELTLRASRRDIPKFEKHLSQITADPPRVDLDTFVVETRTSFQSTGILYAHGTTWRQLGDSATNLQVLTSNQLQTLLATLPTNSFSYTMPAKSTVTTFSGRSIRILGDYESLPSSPPVIPILPGDKSLIIRGHSN